MTHGSLLLSPSPATSEMRDALDRLRASNRAVLSTVLGVAYLLTVGLLSVVFSWLCAHTVFMLTYARLYYGDEPGGIDFNEPDGPIMSTSPSYRSRSG